MGDNVDLQLVLKRVDDVLAEVKAMRGELVTLNESVRALARADVGIRRDLREVKDRVVILTAAFGDEPPLHT